MYYVMPSKVYHYILYINYWTNFTLKHNATMIYIIYSLKKSSILNSINTFSL